MKYILAIVFSMVVFSVQATPLRLSLQEIREGKYADAEYVTSEGYVAYVFAPPCDCPYGAQCDPCAPPYVLIGEKEQIHAAAASYNVVPDYSVPKAGFSQSPFAPFIVVFTSNSKTQYKIGKPYTFTIEIVKGDGGVFFNAQKDPHP